MSHITFYNTQVQKISKELYPKEYLTRQIVSSKQFIDRHFTEDVNLEDLASGAFISKFHFIRLFKLYYGVTPHQYLMAVRIRKAKQLLRPETTISDICIAVGFKSFTSFTALFKKITGFTPSAFKQKKFQNSNFQEA